MQALKTRWSERSQGKSAGKHKIEIELPRRRLVVAHFMLGNTYPFTESDWSTTFDQAEETGLDALALNLGPDWWQYDQAMSAFKVLADRPGPSNPASSSNSLTHDISPFATPGRRRKIQLFLSMDMMVLPGSTIEDGQVLRGKVVNLLSQEGYLRWESRKVLSTFGGHEASFGSQGWKDWLRGLQDDLKEDVFFWPSFFLPPETLLSDPNLDGIFNWNAGWPFTKSPISLESDQPFLSALSKSSRPVGKPVSRKSYMTAVSPLFFTHYGKTGEWAWNKNWIYPSDNLLYPTRWNQLLSLPPAEAPDMIQVITWNDHGESHAIAPVIGAQPGSEAWTDGMGHEAFREMTAWYVSQWRDGAGELDFLRTESDKDGVEDGGGDGARGVKVWMWYRTHPKDLVAKDDNVGPPERLDWAQDLINIIVILPQPPINLAPGGQPTITILNGSARQSIQLDWGRSNALTLPFVPGHVTFEVVLGDRAVVSGQGRDIDGEVVKYNFNIWSGSWSGLI